MDALGSVVAAFATFRALSRGFAFDKSFPYALEGRGICKLHSSFAGYESPNARLGGLPPPAFTLQKSSIRLCFKAISMLRRSDQ